MKKASGFTLIELMLTVTILAIVMTVAVPPMADFISRYRSETQRQRLFDLIVLSRSKAYSLGEIHTLCPKAGEGECGSDWASGALLFADSNGNGEREPDEPVLRAMEKMPQGASVSWSSFGNRNYLQFRPNGRTLSQSGNFAYCPPDRNPKYGWIIVLNATGRPYFGRDSDGDGVMESGSGTNLTCS